MDASWIAQEGDDVFGLSRAIGCKTRGCLRLREGFGPIWRGGIIDRAVDFRPAV